MTTKAQRRKQHAVINNLTHEEVAAFVRKSLPGARRSTVDFLAKLMISDAHRRISPRKKPADK
jgi:hypothetical protein